MSTVKSVEVVVRPKRQVTLPKELCDRLKIEVGDMLVLKLEGSKIVARPRKMVAIEALRAMREAFRRSGISEQELQETGRRIRQEIIRERYGKQAR